MSHENDSDPNSTIMRPCFRVPELRRLVLVELEAISFSSLAPLAATCKELSEDCLDHLWRIQSTLFYLFRTMPNDLFDYQVIEDEDWGPQPCITRFRRRLRATDWERYDYYAPRIRRLKVTTGGLGIGKRALVFLSRNRRAVPFLPSLRRVKVCPLFEATLDVYMHVPMFLGDGNAIRKLSIVHVNTSIPDFGVYIRLLTGICKNVRELKISWDERLCHNDMLKTYEHVISIIRDDLEALFTPDGMDVTADMLDRLQNLPSLELLGPINLNTNAGILFKSLQCDVFPRLHRLFVNVNWQCWDAAHHFLRVLRHNMLSELCITQVRGDSNLSSEQPSFHFIRATLQEIGQSQTSLKALHLESINTSNVVGASDDGVSQLITPLLSLSDLQELTFDSSFTLQIDDGVLARMSDAFPRITHLTLTSGESYTHPPNMTLAGLLPLVKRCPSLTNLYMTLQCQPFDLEILDESIASTNQVQSVMFSNSPVKQPRELTRCLLALFPNATFIRRVERNCLAETEEGWVAASRLLDEELEARNNAVDKAKRELWEERIAALCC